MDKNLSLSILQQGENKLIDKDKALSLSILINSYSFVSKSIREIDKINYYLCLSLIERITIVSDRQR